MPAKRYIIGYDKRGGHDYVGLHRTLKALGGQHLLESLWVVNRPGESSDQIYGHLRSWLDSDDGVFIACLDTAAWDERYFVNLRDTKQDTQKTVK